MTELETELLQAATRAEIRAQETDERTAGVRWKYLRGIHEAEARRQLAADLAEIRRFAGPNPDVDYMAGLLLENFHAGRYGAAAPAAPGVPATCGLCGIPTEPCGHCPVCDFGERSSVCHQPSALASEPRGDE